MRWNPWTMENTELFLAMIRAAKLAGVIEDNFKYETLPAIADNAIKLEIAGDMSRDEVIAFVGLWMGRYQGNQDNDRWVPKDLAGDTAVERAKDGCHKFIEACEKGETKEFWEAFARLVVALSNIHPENDLGLLPRIHRHDE